MRKTSNKSAAASTPIILVKKKEWNDWLKKQTPETAAWVRASGFMAEPQRFCVVSDKTQGISIVAITGEKPDIWSLASLPEKLPAGTYRLQSAVDSETADALLLGWLLGSYRFTRYKKQSKNLPELSFPSTCKVAHVMHMAESINLARDLINTPANDLGPVELAAACKQVANRFHAEYDEIAGEELLHQNYPAIYTVGQASSRAPRLIDIHWGNKNHPKVTLVGKGVCFDSGGLDIKPSSGMKLMKKDMGGAACVIAIAQMIMASGLPVRLRVLIPAVENSISGNAYRPSDVIATRKGITVEVGNTDAEGRLILCDALWEADQEKPDLLIDCATLTGAARTALGMDIPVIFTPDDTLAKDLQRHGMQQNDPVWQLPLWQGYREMLNSAIADINSAPDGPYAGAITAALYLKEFVQETMSWAHIDMSAWNLSKRAGRPQGGEAMAVRAIFSLVNERYAKK
jgi:leucyl aminopeptidase